jgi:tRNA threonylcarbamoyl adenosine modification protein YeaZ
MKILAIEFSSPQRSVAVVDGLVLARAEESGSEGTRPLALIEQTLRQARLEREEIECIAVGLGPGSYTGIRTAISLAQGWQLARGVRLLGISSVEGLAWQALAGGLRGAVNLVIDAQRHEFYLARYELDDRSASVLEPLRLAAAAEVQQRAERGEVILGPEVDQRFPQGRLVYPHAAVLAQLATRRSDFVPGEQLEPIYLRETSFVKAPPSRPVPL